MTSDATNDDSPPRALVGFFLGRSFVSGAFALANQAVPDLTPALGSDAKAWIASLDSVNALLGFVTRPMWGALIDAVGRKPALVMGCVGAGVARRVYAADPTSPRRYAVYRILNFASNIPVMQASVALLADACGGRSTKRFATVNRRMWMWLAVVRMCVVWLAGVMAEAEAHKVVDEEGKPPHEPDADEIAKQRAALQAAAMRQLAGAGMYSFAAALAFALLTKETLRKRTEMASPWAAVTRSVGFFFRTPERRALVPVVLLSRLPMFAMSPTTVLCRETFKWGPKDRALFTTVENASEVLVPLLASELTRSAPKSFQLDLRISALIALNAALTPVGATLLLNPVLGRLVEGGGEFNEALAAARTSYLGGMSEGEGMLEAALATLEVPLGLVLPGLFLRLSSWAGSTRAPFWVVAGGLLAASEWAWPRAVDGLALSAAVS